MKTRPDATGCYVLALVFGALASYVDLSAEEVYFTALLLLVFGALLGFAQPRRAWAYALTLGACVPAAHLLALIVDYPLPYQITDFNFTFIAIVPALAGAYCGALVGWLAEPRREGEDS